MRCQFYEITERKNENKYMAVYVNSRLIKSAVAIGLAVTLVKTLDQKTKSIEKQLVKLSYVSQVMEDSVDYVRDVDMDKSQNSSIKALFCVGEIPQFYKEQLLAQGYSIESRLDEIDKLTLEIVEDEAMYWLSFCSNIQTLELNFKETPCENGWIFVQDFVNLHNLIVRSVETNYYERVEDWEKAKSEVNEVCRFGSMIDAGYDDVKKCYFVTSLSEANLDVMSELLERCPNVKNLYVYALPYRTTTSLSWMKVAKSLEDIYIKVYFQNDWDLTRQATVFDELKELKVIRIRNNTPSMSPEDMRFMREVLCKLDVPSINYSGLYSNSFHFTCEEGKKILSIGLADKLDYGQLCTFDEIDFGRSGIYYAGVFMSEEDYDFLKASGLNITFGDGYSEEDFKSIARQIDNMYRSIDFPVDASEQIRLNCILKYIFETYHYGPVEGIDIEKRYYKDGPLYGGLVGKKIVCGNYATILNALLKRAGIESYYVRNSKHAWVLARIDGTYYYVDVTYMDSVYDDCVKKGENRNVAFTKALSGEMYLMDPYLVDRGCSGISHEEDYADGRIPYWLDIYRMREEAIMNKEITLDF